MTRKDSSLRRTGYLELLACVLKGQRPEYFQGPCGRFWCSFSGLDPEYAFRLAHKQRGTYYGQSYYKTPYCHCSPDMQGEKG